jgi:benzodiazapine receptor
VSGRFRVSGRAWPWTTAGVVAAAVAGGVATDPGSDWFRGLQKPAIYPPPQTFALVWTPLYALIAWAVADGVERARATGDDDAARAIGVAFAANMALNAGWTAVFFRGHRPWAAFVELLALQASNVDLVRRVRVHSPRAAAALLPYLAWTTFAGVLTVAFARRNRD